MPPARGIFIAPALGYPNGKTLENLVVTICKNRKPGLISGIDEHQTMSKSKNKNKNKNNLSTQRHRGRPNSKNACDDKKNAHGGSNNKPFTRNKRKRQPFFEPMRLPNRKWKWHQKSGKKRGKSLSWSFLPGLVYRLASPEKEGSNDYEMNQHFLKNKPIIFCSKVYVFKGRWSGKSYQLPRRGPCWKPGGGPQSNRIHQPWSGCQCGSMHHGQQRHI